MRSLTLPPPALDGLRRPPAYEIHTPPPLVALLPASFFVDGVWSAIVVVRNDFIKGFRIQELWRHLEHLALRWDDVFTLLCHWVRVLDS